MLHQRGGQGPSGVALQGEALNHWSSANSMAWVESIAGNGAGPARQV